MAAGAARGLLFAGAGLCFLAGLALVGWAGLPRAGGTFTEDGAWMAPEPGAFAPAFTAHSADGDEIALADFASRPVVLNFWATWCAPCAAEMPELQRLHEAYAEQIAVIGINTGESAGMVRAWAAEHHLTFGLLLDEAGAIAAQYRLRGQPATFILGPDGRISAILYGPQTFDALERALRPYLT